MAISVNLARRLRSVMASVSPFLEMQKLLNLSAPGGTIAAADVVLSAGFGSTATVAVGAGSTDKAGKLTITSSGTGQGASPTATLTLKAALAAVPFVIQARGNDTNQPTVIITCTPTTTTLVFKFQGTPVAAEVYNIHFHVRGA